MEGGSDKSAHIKEALVAEEVRQVVGDATRPIICYKCNKPVHKSNACHRLANNGETNLIDADDIITLKEDGVIF